MRRMYVFEDNEIRKIKEWLETAQNIMENDPKKLYAAKCAIDIALRLIEEETTPE